MTSPREYTQAQLKAFAWLPSDGSAKVITASKMNVNALWDLRDEELVRGAGGIYRLTPAGQAEKARLIAERIIREN